MDDAQDLEYQKTTTTDHVVIMVDHLQTNDDPKFSKTKSLRRLTFSKPKARFADINYPPPEQRQLYVDSTQSSSSDDDDEDRFNEEEDDDDDQTQNRSKHRSKKRKRKIMNKRALIEFILFLIITTCLICSLTLENLKYKNKWGLVIWKWCLMVLVLFCGRLVSGWLVGFSVFLIERNFMLREKVLYFVYGLRKSFQNCVWLGLALSAWMIMFDDVHKQHKVLQKIFQALIAVLISAIIWLIKILLVKVLASSFHVATYFDRMKESVFNNYILDSLSGPPLDEEEREEKGVLKKAKTLPAMLRTAESRKFGSGLGRKIDMEKLRKLSMHKRGNAWSVKRLVNYVKKSGLWTISKTVDDFGNGESEICSEWEARNAGQRIFKNVAKPHAK